MRARQRLRLRCVHRSGSQPEAGSYDAERKHVKSKALIGRARCQAICCEWHRCPGGSLVVIVKHSTVRTLQPICFLALRKPKHSRGFLDTSRVAQSTPTRERIHERTAGCKGDCTGCTCTRPSDALRLNHSASELHACPSQPSKEKPKMCNGGAPIGKERNLLWE